MGRKIVRFECLLDEQPTELVPKQTLTRAEQLFSSLVVNPSCVVDPKGLRCLPFVENFSRERQMIWLLDPATDALLPFWVGPEFLRWLVDALPGEPLVKTVPPRVRSVLALAGLLVSPDYKRQRRREWSKAVAHCRSLFERGYACIPPPLNLFHIAALRRYYRELIGAGLFHAGDDQCRGRFVLYNDSVARFFQHQLTPTVCQVVGTPVQPSFAYFACYRGGAELVKHVDREQCEFSISLCLDFVPEPLHRSPWPLYLETQQGPLAVTQAIGDALLYKGTQVPHYRTKLAEGSTSSSLLFFYVRTDFAGRLE